jgi:hypothetical protein
MSITRESGAAFSLDLDTGLRETLCEWYDVDGDLGRSWEIDRLRLFGLPPGER